MVRSNNCDVLYWFINYLKKKFQKPVCFKQVLQTNGYFNVWKFWNL